MATAAEIGWMTSEQQERIVQDVERERSRVWQFLRRSINESDAEEILQDVFAELVEAYRLMTPIEHVGAWLMRVARNRVIDRLRRKKPDASLNESVGNSEGDTTELQDLLPSADDGPEAEFARRVLIDELEDAVEELPPLQREVFIAHEIEGRSFSELAAELGVGVNTLLSRKHAAVTHLRKRLRSIYEELGLELR
jgi:RNA polymerase sigma factor (sigma-70 family)